MKDKTKIELQGDVPGETIRLIGLFIDLVGHRDRGEWQHAAIVQRTLADRGVLVAFNGLICRPECQVQVWREGECVDSWSDGKRDG